MTRALPDRRTDAREGARRAPPNATPGTATGAGPRRALADFLGRLADAFAEGDLTALAGCHVTPVLFVTEWDSTIFSSAREVAEGFRGVVDEHRRRGLQSPSYRVETMSTPASRIVEVGVRWTFHDAEGRPVLHDRYRYVLRRVDGKGLLITAVVVLGGSPVQAP